MRAASTRLMGRERLDRDVFGRGDPEPIAPRRLGALGSVYVTHPSLGDYTATRAELNATAHRLFDLPNEEGLCEFLRGDADLAALVRPTGVENLSLVTAGEWDSRAVQALLQNHTRAAFDRLRKEYDFILVDSAPILPVADTLLAAQLVDAVLLSVLQEVSRLPFVYSAYQRLTALGVPVLGAVINGAHGDTYPVSYPYHAAPKKSNA